MSDAHSCQTRKPLRDNGFKSLPIGIPSTGRIARVCNGMDAVEKHRQRVKQNLPANGAIRLMVITEKQYEAIDILLGKLTEADDKFQCEQLSIF